MQRTSSDMRLHPRQHMSLLDGVCREGDAASEDTLFAIAEAWFSAMAK